MAESNPFTFGPMITDPQRFIGRRAELAIITARLNGSQPQGSAIVGPRRIGKSSLLHSLYQPRQDETRAAPQRSTTWRRSSSAPLRVAARYTFNTCKMMPASKGMRS